MKRLPFYFLAVGPVFAPIPMAAQGPGGSPAAWKFSPPCLDACDCNDDGRLDLADATCILTFLFQFGEFPPPPGPGLDMGGRDAPPGIDPTEDKLDCQAGGDC